MIAARPALLAGRALLSLKWARREGETVRAFLAVIASALVLAGCVSKEELQARHDAAMAQNAAADDQKCQSFGAVPGSERYIQCRTSLATSRAQAAALAQPPMSPPPVFPLATCRPIPGGAVSCE
jgi:hypothetical protein